MEHPSRAEIVFLDTHFETLPQTGARAARAPKICDLSSKSEQKVTQKLTHVSSLCSLRNICGELGDPRWRQVSHSAFFPFPCKIMGRAMLVHLRIFLGVRRCHAARRLQYIYST